MKLLFITRAYPPFVGGMEKFANDFYENYESIGDIELLANTGGKKTLPFFLIKTVVYLIFYSRKYDVIHLYDAVLSPLILVIKIVSRSRISFTVNGLDIVYAHFSYQKIIPFFLKKADKIIAISQYTMRQCLLRGIPEEKLEVIPVGFTFKDNEYITEERRILLMSRFGIPLGCGKILITVGRLVKRKGHAWFIEHVFQNLPNDFVYAVVGDGPERDAISELVRRLELDKRVFLFGRVSSDEKDGLYQIAEMFIMPNISIENDQEGFGIVLLEAGCYSIPVVASNIEGICDVVFDGQTGRLINEKDSVGFIDAILSFNPDRTKIIPLLESTFSWRTVIDAYYDALS